MHGGMEIQFYKKHDGANKTIWAICGVWPDAKSYAERFLNIMGFIVFHANNFAGETFRKTP